MKRSNAKTPASTTFVRTVRNFGGSRFRRSVEEGFLEEFLLEDEVYNDIDANFSSVAVGNDEKAFEKVHTFDDMAGYITQPSKLVLRAIGKAANK